MKAKFEEQKQLRSKTEGEMKEKTGLLERLQAEYTQI
jgi:hypothetical protein